MKSFKYIALLFCFQLIGQQLTHPLPIVRNGRWYLFDGNKEIQLPITYTDVQPFDEKGIAIFSEGNNHGLIGIYGKEITKSIYNDLEQIGNGIYKQNTKAGYELFTSDKKTSILCNWSQKMDEKWLVYSYDTSIYLLNLNWEKGIPIHSTLDVQASILNYLILKSSNSNFQLFDPLGNLIDSLPSKININENNFYFKGLNKHIYVDVFGKFDFPKNADNVYIYENSIKYSYLDKTKLIDKKSKKTIVEALYDNIEYEGDNYKIFKGKNQGLMNKNGKILIQPIYDLFLKIPTGYFVFKNQLKGYLDSNYKEKIPCHFKEIHFEKNFIFTETFLGGKGLLQLQTFNEILPAFYSKLDIYDNYIKAYESDKLVILYLNEDKTIKSKVLLDHVMTIKRYNNFSNFEYDHRLLSIGWYFDTVGVFNKNHQWVKTELKWGIKNSQDSVLMKPSVKNPIYVEDAPITLVRSGTSDINLFNNYLAYKNINFYSIYNHEIGKKIKHIAVFNFSMKDFKKGDYARFIHQTGEGFYFRDHTIKLVDYIEPGDQAFVRYCNFTEANKTFKKSKTAVTVDQIYFDTILFKKDSQLFEFKNARWNYINKNGDSLFDEPFDYASNFYLNTAIVKGKKGWGLVNKDSIIIPLIYSNIERLKEFSDTIFKVEIAQKGTVYFDSTLTSKLFCNYTYEKKANDIILFSERNDFILTDKNNSILTHLNHLPKIKENGTYFIKEKQERHITNLNGNTLTITASPIEIINNQFIIAEINNKLGVLNFDGDTLLPFIFSEIEHKGNYFLTNDSKNKSILSEQFESIKKIKVGRFMVDLKTNNWAIVEIPNVKIFNSKNEKINTWKSEIEFINFENNLFFTKNGEVVNLLGVKINSIIKFNEFEVFENNYIALIDNENKWFLYNENWELLTDEQLKNKNLNYLGDDVFSSNTKKGLIIYDFKNKLQYEQYTDVKGDFSQTFIAVKKDGFWLYLDRNFKDVFNKRFLDASPFKNNLATIADHRGYSIIGKDGLTKTLTSFPRINQINNNLFETSKRPFYGIFDSNGKIIIEPIYEKIIVINSNLFQVIKDGEIHYFNLKGDKLY